MSTAANSGPITRAIEIRLGVVLTAAGVLVPGTAELAVEWDGKPFDRTRLITKAAAAKVIPRFVQMTMIWGDDLVIEMGPTPRVEGGGHAKFGLNTGAGLGYAAMHDLTKIVAEGFPLYADLVQDGLNVRIDTSTPGEIVTVGAWAYRPLRVNWNVWRV